jgi:integration host factor subunit beta
MKDAEVVVQTILDVMCNSLMDGQRVEIRGFGIFNLHYRPPRVGRNPKSGEAVTENTVSLSSDWTVMLPP